MDSKPEERLGLNGDFTSADLKRAKKSVARLYHPDSSPNLADELKTVMNRRMAEFNGAYTAIRNKKNWNN
jgi:preprotein translocase subunit Sec63